MNLQIDHRELSSTEYAAVKDHAKARAEEARGEAVRAFWTALLSAGRAARRRALQGGRSALARASHRSSPRIAH